MRNPYLNRVMIREPEGFFGRRREVAKIFARIGASRPQSVSIVGERRIGKSSLLNYLCHPDVRRQHLESPDSYAFVPVDLQEQREMGIRAFFETVFRGVREALGDPRLADFRADYEGARRALVHLHEGGRKIVLLFDEFDAITRNPNFPEEFFAFLRAVANKYDVAYVTTSGRDLQQLCHTDRIADSPFFNIFSNLFLTTFEREEALSLIQGPSEAAGASLAPHAEAILDLAGLFPFFIQVACSAFFEQLAEGRVVELDRARSTFLEEAEPHFKYIYEHFDDDQRHVLADLADRRAIPARLGYLLSKLKRDGYVVNHGGDDLIFSSVFLDCVHEARPKKPAVPVPTALPGQTGAADSDRWRQVERIYHAAATRDADERARFLREVCGSDEALRQEVESLLSQDRSAAAFLAEPVMHLAAKAEGGGDAKAAMVGPQIAGYQILSPLGAGGMGEVFRARDLKLGRDVAIKVLPASFAADPERLRRFQREARMLATLNHPHIGAIYGLEESDGILALVLELVEGDTLAEALAGSKLSISEALGIVQQAAKALEAAHDKGIIHRDLKPANIKITPDNVVKVLDFGLAKAVAGETATPDLSRLPTITIDGTRDGAILGTATYMSPEQARGRPVDKRTDIWAFGCVLYEALSGRVAFPGETISDTIAAVLEREPDWAALPARTPEGVRQLLARCLDKDAKRRLRDMGEASIVLADTLGEIARTPAAPAPRRYGMARTSAILAASMLAVIAGVVGVNSYRSWIAPVVPAIRSLAVLPFENSTGDLGQDYVADGFSDGLAAELGRLPALRVVSRVRTAKYRDAKTARSEIGRELDAEAVLAGSVARVGDRVRIVTELVPTATSRRIWTETYERPVDELFALQREVASAVASAIRIEPSEQEQRRLANRRSVNPEAYDLYLRGLSHVFLNSEEDVDRSIAFFEKSASLDSTFVPTQAYLARSYAIKSSTYRVNDPQWEEKGFAAVQRTLALDPESPEAHFAQALIIWKPSHGFASREALKELRKALAAQPTFDDAWHWHGTILFHVGHLDAGMRSIERALDINPGHTLARFRFGPIYVYQQLFENALAALNRVPPESFPAQWIYQRAWALISLGRLDEAAQVLDRALRDNPTDQGGVLHSARAMTRAKRGDRKGAEADIAEAVRAGKGFVHFHHTAYSIGAIYATLGELDKAQEWIEMAANDGFPNFAYFERDVHLERLRTVPRFRAYLLQLRRDWEHIPGEPFAPSF